MDIFAAMGLSSLPWITRVYLVLVFVFAVLVLLSSLPPFTANLGTVASESLKMVLAALLGALSQSGLTRRGIR